MKRIDALRSSQKTQQPDHPPVVPGTRGRAMLFAASIIVSALSPLALGFRMGACVPAPAALDWTLAIDSRTAAAAEKIHRPKIVFIGGSNIRFGVDAPKMALDLGVPVINYGLHAGLGIDLITSRAIQSLKPGDIAIYSPELSHFRRNGDGAYNDDLRHEFLAAHPGLCVGRPELFFSVQWWRARYRCSRIRADAESRMNDRFQKMLGAVPSGGIFDRFFGARIAAVFGGKVSPQPPRHVPSPDINERDPYAVDAIDPDGNINIARPGPMPYASWHLSNPDEHNPAAMDLVASRGAAGFSMLKEACASRHCTFCVMPPLRLSVPEFDQTAMLCMEQKFINFAVKNGAITLIKPGENVLPRPYGYDTDYHLNDAGVRMMQPRLVAAIRAIFSDHDK